jgi:hypothetical protein
VPETDPLTTQIWDGVKAKFPSQKTDWERFPEKNIFFSVKSIFKKNGDLFNHPSSVNRHPSSVNRQPSSVIRPAMLLLIP